jgi:hypothetical protein
VPPLIELRCPKCDGILSCEHPVNIENYSDTPSGWWCKSGEDKNFVARCQSCFFTKKHLSYFDLPLLGELYFQSSVGTSIFWAWNHEHLQMLLEYLQGKETNSSRWQIYQRFIPGAWKKSSRRNTFIKTARKMLSECKKISNS